MNPTVVLASGNAGKLAELVALLSAHDLQLRAMSDFDVQPAAETGISFLDNALLKARAVAAQTGLPALADDSGLMVDALGGAPGVQSARFAGEHATDADNNALLLQRLDGISRRSARFCCVLVLVRTPDDPFPLVAQGSWEGRILTAPRGTHGFGYDPLFEDLEQGRSAAEMDRQAKAQRSHRGHAARALDTLLARYRHALVVPPPPAT